MQRLVFTGGGTAGHVVPNLALIPYLKDSFEFSYIGSENGIEKKLVSPIMPYYPISTAKLVRKFTPSNLAVPYKVYQGYKEAKSTLSLIRPDIVFSKGGYVSVPVIYAAHSLKIPVITHESDLTKGLANKISANKCRLVLTSFKETAEKFKNGRFVGSPIRQELFNANKLDAFKALGLSEGKPVLTVLGGSQGSRSINSAIRKILPEITPKFNVYHIVGKGNIDKSIACDGYFQTEYRNDMENVFAVSSVVVSRAGSNTLFELLALRIPSLVIPLPKGVSRGDQILNAEYFFKKGLINLLTEQDMTEKSLINGIFATYTNRFNLLREMENENVKNGAETIAEIIKTYADRE